MPHVRSARSGDGTNIAYSTLGEGPPLVLMPAILFSHLEKMWELPPLRRGLEQLAEHWTVVRYDNRGCGLSGREVNDFSLEAHLLDLEAVADTLGLERLALNGPMHSGPVAVAFGIVAMYLTVFVIVASWLRSRIGTSRWRKTHLLAVPAFVLALMHGLFAGSDGGRAWLFWTYMGTGLIVVFLVLVRGFTAGYRPPRAEPPPRVAATPAPEPVSAES